MAEESSDPFSHSDWVVNPAPAVPTQSAFGLPPMSSLGSVSSMPVAHSRWQAAVDEPRAGAEAAAGDTFFRRREFSRAWQRYRRAVQLNPSNEVYFFKLGATAWMAGRLDLAIQNMLEALRISPNYALAHDALGQWYMESRQLDRALTHSETAIRLDPKDVDYVITRGAVLIADGQTTPAWELIRPLVDGGVRHPHLAILYAKLAPQLGHEREALVKIDSALQADILCEIAPRLHFAAASLLDRIGRFDEAFAHLRQAKESVPKSFDADAVVEADRKIAYFTAQRLRCLPKSTLDSRRIVFIVGMPRSGTTLVEQVLASHPQVFGGGESLSLLHIYQELGSPKWAEAAQFPDCLDSLSLSGASRLARSYLSAVDSSGAGSAVYVTDKTPLNCLHLGLIQLLMPDCHVIHCTRSPLDTCLSCFFTDFSSGNEFASDLEHLGAMFRQYQRLMAHWKQVLTIPIHEVRYEDLVLDLEGQSRRITDFLHLPWDERCLKFHENPRRVYTASKEQVRQPVYLSSIGRWKNYQKQITKLIDALATA
jgi:tetratricopeptide (TPR) repeat protein